MFMSGMKSLATNNQLGHAMVCYVVSPSGRVSFLAIHGRFLDGGKPLSAPLRTARVYTV